MGSHGADFADGWGAEKASRLALGIVPPGTTLPPPNAGVQPWAAHPPPTRRRYQQTTHGGGIRDLRVIAWPAGLPARDELRHGFHHATDLVPTLPWPDRHRPVDAAPQPGLPAAGR